MLTIYVVRHAESEANAAEVLASRLPFPLSARGRIDAAAAAADFSTRILDGKIVDHLLVSPLVRAVETAQPFAELLSLSMEMDERLVEQELGRFSGMSYEAIKDMPGYEHRRELRWDWVPEGGGESYRMIADRLKPFFCDLEERFSCCMGSNAENRIVLIVTHAVTMRLIHGLLENTLPEYPFWLSKNGEIWEIDYHGLGYTHAIKRHFPGNSAARDSGA